MFKRSLPKPIFIILLVPLLMMCGHARKTAETPKKSIFDDPLGRYPNSAFIAAVGSGDTQEAAKERAISDVAKVIEVDINAQQQLVEEYLESGTADDMQLQRKSSFSRQINLTTQQSLKNVNIGKTWMSNEDGRYYAVAYLDRMETAEIYKQELATIDQQVSDYYTESQKAPEKLNQLAYINKAISLAVQRDAMASQLNTISQGLDTFTPTISPSKLAKTRRLITQNITVKPELTFEKYEEFPGAVGEVLQAFGFQLTNGEPDVLVTGSLKMEQLERQGYFVRWSVDLHFKDAASNTEFLTYTDDDREGSTSYGEAERRAAIRMSSAIKKKLYDRLQDYFDSLVASK